MKYLSHYTEQGLTDLFETAGAFFAFGQKQFDAKKVDGVTYVSLGSGLYCPKPEVDCFLACYKDVISQAMSLDVEENGKDGVIRRELSNHECFYTHDISACVDALADYPISEADILEVYREMVKEGDLCS